MKQVLIRSGSPVVVEVPAPQLADHEILVEVAFSLISTGTETAYLASSGTSLLRRAFEEPARLIRGLQMMREAGLRRTLAAVNTQLGSFYPIGYSCSGVVVACGRNTSGFAPGDRVACAGASKANHAEIIVVPQNLAVRVPAEVDAESASSATIGAIALHAVRRADVRLGESVAVIGLGLIGQLTVQLLRAAGCRVAGVDVDPARVSLAMSLGMTVGAEASGGGAVNVMSNFTNGRGVDAVIVTASSESAEVLQQAMEMLRKKGTVVVVGEVPLQVDRSPFYEKEADLLISCSYGPGRYDPEYEEQGRDYPYAYVRWTETRNMAEYLQLVAEGKVNFKALLGRVWPLTEAPEAYADLKQKKHVAVLLSNFENRSATALATRAAVGNRPVISNGVLRTGIVGAGNFARAVHLPNLKRLRKEFAISAVVCRTGTNALNVAQQYGAVYASTSPDELFQDPELDLILIASRHDLHAQLAARAAAHGKAVLLEKPAALTKSELENLVTAFQASSTMLAVGFNRRFSPLIYEARSVMNRRSGPVFVTYRMNAGHVPPESWIQGPEGGGRIIGEACHIFDLFNYLVGRFPEELTALPLRPSSRHIPATDNFVACVRYSDGSLCTLTYTSLGSSELPKEAMEASFDGKSLALDDYRKLSFYGLSKKPVRFTRQEKGYLEELQAIANHLRKGAPLPMTLEEIESASKTSFIVDDLVRNGARVAS